MFHSDRLSSIFSEYYKTKTNHIVKRPIAKKILDGIGNVGKYVSNKLFTSKQYTSTKNPNIVRDFGVFNGLIENAKKKYADEKESWKATTVKSFFSTPNQVGLVDGFKKLLAISK